MSKDIENMNKTLSELTQMFDTVTKHIMTNDSNQSKNVKVWTETLKGFKENVYDYYDCLGIDFDAHKNDESVAK